MPACGWGARYWRWPPFAAAVALAVSGAAASEPAGIGPVILGSDPVAGVYGSRVTFVGAEGPLYFARMPDLHVSHLVFVPERDTVGGDHHSPPSLEELLSRMNGKLGVEAEYVGWQHYVWPLPDAGHGYELQAVDAAGGAMEVRVVLRTDDPARICGDGDGFAPWIDGLRQAIAADERERILSAFAYPFLDQAAVVMAFPSSRTMYFEDATALRDRLDDAEVRSFLNGIVEAFVDCDPVGYEGHAGDYRLLVASGAVQASRRAGEWRLIRRYYVP